MRIAVITPHYKEDPNVIARCVKSVANQTVECDHLLVHDDPPHGDYGNPPRGVACVQAAAERYDAIALLDADNWYDPDHLAYCLSFRKPGTDYIAAKRRFIADDGSVLDVPDEPGHVDTSCYIFLPGSYHLLHHWALMPKELSCVGDRVMHQVLLQNHMRSVRVPWPTVNYLTLWGCHYQAAGWPPPANAKPGVGAEVGPWLKGLTPEQRGIASRHAGVRL